MTKPFEVEREAPAGALGGDADRGVVFGSQVLDALGVRRGRVVAAPWWSHSRHRQTTVSIDAIASMLIISVAGRRSWVFLGSECGRYGVARESSPDVDQGP